MSDWIKFWMFLCLGTAIASFSLGVWEMQYLGSYGNQGVWYPFFHIIGYLNGGDFGKAFTFFFTDMPGIMSSLWNMFIWNYAVLHTELGTIVRLIILFPGYAALSIGFVAFFKQLSPFGAT
jgi:hypothetical protein